MTFGCVVRKNTNWPSSTPLSLEAVAPMLAPLPPPPATTTVMSASSKVWGTSAPASTHRRLKWRAVLEARTAARVEEMGPEVHVRERAEREEKRGLEFCKE